MHNGTRAERGDQEQNTVALRGVSSCRRSSGLDDRSAGVVLGAVLVRVRVLMLDMVGIFGVTVLVVVMLGASGALMVSLTVRVGVRVLVTGVVGIFGVTVLVLGVLRRALTHRDTPGYSLRNHGAIWLRMSLYMHARRYG